jgi:hypothetical protein
MNVSKPIVATLLALLVPLAALAAATPDAVVKAQLEKKGTPYEIDDDGDFAILVRIDDERTQQVWVRSVVETTTHQSVREIWSRGYQADGMFPARIANELLEHSNTLKIGSWVKNGDSAMIVIKIPADASADVLDESIDYAASIADKMELELTGKDDF